MASNELVPPEMFYQKLCINVVVAKTLHFGKGRYNRAFRKRSLTPFLTSKFKQSF